MAIEIVDLPIKNSDFPVRYANVYQRVPIEWLVTVMTCYDHFFLGSFLSGQCEDGGENHHENHHEGITGDSTGIVAWAEGCLKTWPCRRPSGANGDRYHAVDIHGI